MFIFPVHIETGKFEFLNARHFHLLYKCNIMDYEIRLNEIKRLLLLKFDVVTPGDCEGISEHINNCVQRHISVTTLKRLFGFAVQKYKFSAFTLFTLSQFLNIEYNKENKVNNSAEEHEVQWSTIKNKTDTITNKTLKEIGNLCGIPIEMTVSRKFAEKDFEHFQESNYIFTSIVALAGYGKSVLLSHLTYKLFRAHTAPYKTSTLLFISAGDFFNEDEVNFDVEHRLKNLLCIKTEGNVIDYIQRHHEVTGGQFIIMLDGFDDHFFLRWTTDQLFNTLKNLFISLKYCNHIKVLISMRTGLWRKFYQRIHLSEFLKSSWFPGSHYRSEDHSNMPQLFKEEVEELLSNLNKTSSSVGKPLLKELLKSPHFIKPYFKMEERFQDLQPYLNPISFDLITFFVEKNIYESKYSLENSILLKKIVQLSKFGLAGACVPLNNLPDINIYESAYEELISKGILIEEIKLYKGQSQAMISFKEDYVFHYFLFVELLEKQYLDISEECFKHLYQKYKNTSIYMPLLQWSIRFAIKTGNIKTLGYLFNKNLRAAQINQLILFLAEEIRYRSKYNSLIKNLLNELRFIN